MYRIVSVGGGRVELSRRAGCGRHSILNMRNIPSIDRLLREEEGLNLCLRYGRPRVTEALRESSAALRAAKAEPEDMASVILSAAEQALETEERPSLRSVINATGVILHTNLGRAPLAAVAQEQILACSGYSNVELDLHSGARGSRHDHVISLLRRLTGAPAALVVNNCAAAMVLIVEVLARGREVIVSRGELVEIGGAFRVPEILARAGCRLVEVGTTNRTRLDDFRQAITPETGLILSTHLSNFSMTGFVESPRPEELAALGRQAGIPTCLDLGSGLLRPQSGLLEPSVLGSVAAGFDLIAFSGDKLLGATQAGIILGRQDLVDRLARDPLQRALRVDKLTLAGLEATLRLYLDPERAAQHIPVLVMLAVTSEELKGRAHRLARRLRKTLGQTRVEVQPGESSVGGGSLPGQGLPTWLVVVSVDDEEACAARLRQGEPSLLTRRAQGALCLDVRTLSEEDLPSIQAAFEGETRS